MAERLPLTIARIVGAATELLDTGDGVELSMRSLAAKLGVDPMAIYRHLPNKQAVIQAVLEALVAEIEPPPPHGDWRGRVAVICRAYRAAAHRHPGAFRLLYPHPQMIRSELRVNEAFYVALLEAGLSEEDAVRGATMLLNFAAGFGLDEVTGWLTPRDESERHELARLNTSLYPATRRVLGFIQPTKLDDDFEFGLRVLLDGLAARSR